MGPTEGVVISNKPASSGLKMTAKINGLMVSAPCAKPLNVIRTPITTKDNMTETMAVIRAYSNPAPKANMTLEYVKPMTNPLEGSSFPLIKKLIAAPCIKLIAPQTRSPTKTQIS